MFENERDFRQLVAGLKIDAEPNPAHRERLRRQMLQTFEEAQGGEQRTDDRRQKTESQGRDSSVRRLPFVRLAAAAMVLIAATAAVWSWLGPGRGPATFEQVRVATKRMPWLHAVVSRYHNGAVATEQHWYGFAAEKTFVVMDDGTVLGWDYGAEREKLVYTPRLKAVVVADLSGPGPFGIESAYNLVDAFAALAGGEDEVEARTAEHEGKTVRVYEAQGTRAGLNLGGRPVARVKMAVMADPETKRVVAARVEHRGVEGGLVAREEWVVSYPASGPASVFELGVPASARLVTRTRQAIGTPGDEPTTIPTPKPAGNSTLVPLEITLPKPRFAGTPRNRRVPNLEPARRAPRAAFLTPPGTVNVALGKPVSASDPEPVIGSLDLITDGDKEAAEGSVVELGPAPQHVTIDLQERCELYAIFVWHYHRWPRVYFDVVVQVSDDRTFQTGVKTVFNNDLDNSLGFGAGTDPHYTETYEGKLIDLLSQGSPTARYLRLYSNGNTNDELNHYLEVEVYGRPLN